MIGELIKELANDANAAKQPCDILFGTVTQREPKLTIVTDNQLTLERDMLILTRNVTDYKTWLSFDNEEIKQKVNIYDRAEKENEEKPLPKAVKAGKDEEFPHEPHDPREDDNPEPEIKETTDIKFAKKWYYNTTQLMDEDGNIPEKVLLPAFHDITIYNHLSVGERVVLVKQRGGQKYFVIDRIGDDNTDSFIP